MKSYKHCSSRTPVSTLPEFRMKGTMKSPIYAAEKVPRCPTPYYALRSRFPQTLDRSLHSILVATFFSRNPVQLAAEPCAACTE